MPIEFPILYIDTSGPICQVALCLSEQNVISNSGQSELSHREELSGLIEQVVNRAECTISDLRLVVLASGPGSFTGLRIGYSFVQGLALSKNIPVSTISSHLVSAYTAIEQCGKILVLSDARRNEFFCGEYQNANGVISIMKNPAILSLEQIKQRKLEFTKAGENVTVITVGCHIAELQALQAVDVSKFFVVAWENYYSQSKFYKDAKSLSNLEPEYVREVAAKTILERQI